MDRWNDQLGSVSVKCDSTSVVVFDKSANFFGQWYVMAGVRSGGNELGRDECHPGKIDNSNRELKSVLAMLFCQAATGPSRPCMEDKFAI